MIAAKHTPGPWQLDELGNVGSDAVKNIAVVFSAATRDLWGGSDFATLRHCEANARLIAAAPELLEALIESVALADLSMGEAAKKLGLAPTRSPRMQAMYAKCCAAVAKATGEQA